MSSRPFYFSPIHDIMTAACFSEDSELFSECLSGGTNPFLPVQASSIASGYLRGSLTRLGRMWWHDGDRVENLRRMIRCALYYESSYTSKWIVYRFLCRWCRWHRREVSVREAVWSKKIWLKKSGQGFLGPGSQLYSMLHPGKATL